MIFHFLKRTASLVEITINSEVANLNEGCTLLELMTLKNLRAVNGMALAVNDEVINRKQWESFKLKAHDRVFIIIATQGG